MSALTREEGPDTTALVITHLVIDRTIAHAGHDVFTIAVNTVAAPAGEYTFHTGKGKFILHAQSVRQIHIVDLGKRFQHVGIIRRAHAVTHQFKKATIDHL